MTLGEWIQVRAVIMLTWENARELTDDQLEGQYRLFPVLAKIGRDDAVQAVVEIASTAACESCRSGPRFAPGPGEIIAHIHSKPMTTEQIAAAMALAEQRAVVRRRALGLEPPIDEGREVVGMGNAWNTCPLHGHYDARPRADGPLLDCPRCADEGREVSS